MPSGNRCLPGFPSLLRLAELLQRRPDYHVRLQGHADHIGSNSDNVELALRRAKAVGDFLVKYGAQGAQITVETYGESRPTSDNSFGQGIWMNRRVTLSVADVEGRVISDQGIAPALLAPGPSVLDLENDAS